MTQQEKDWPLKNIRVPGDHDVILGRGGASIHHPGCKAYREMVRSHQRQYVGYDDSRHMKTHLSHQLVQMWRDQSPPGRFLKKDETTGLWNDVGVAMARRKTAQLLREGAGKVRRKIKSESSSDESDEGSYAAPPGAVKIPTKKTQPTAPATATVEPAPLEPTISASFEPIPLSGESTMQPTPAADHALLSDMRAIGHPLVRGKSGTTLQYGQNGPKDSLEMVQMLFGDIINDSKK